jgi:hypothetical protein
VVAFGRLLEVGNRVEPVIASDGIQERDVTDDVKRVVTSCG